MRHPAHMTANGRLAAHELPHAVAQLIADLGPMQTAGLLEIFNAHVVDVLQQLKQFRHGLNLETLGRLAHETKGTAGSYGAMQLHDAATRLGRACRASDIRTVRALLPPFTRCCRSTLALYQCSIQECRRGTSAVAMKEGSTCTTLKSEGTPRGQTTKRKSSYTGDRLG